MIELKSNVQKMDSILINFFLKIMKKYPYIRLVVMEDRKNLIKFENQLRTLLERAKVDKENLAKMIETFSDMVEENIKYLKQGEQGFRMFLRNIQNYYKNILKNVKDKKTQQTIFFVASILLFLLLDYLVCIRNIEKIKEANLNKDKFTIRELKEKNVDIIHPIQLIEKYKQYRRFWIGLFRVLKVNPYFRVLKNLGIVRYMIPHWIDVVMKMGKV